MTQQEIGRPIALVLNQVQAQVRGRLLQMMPEAVRDQVVGELETIEDLTRGEMSFVEQVLQSDLDALMEEGDQSSEARMFAEALPLRVSDLITMVLKQTTPQDAADVIMRLPPVLQGEVLHKVAALDWGVLERRLGEAEVDFLKTLEDSWETPKIEIDPVFASEILYHIRAPGPIRRLLTAMNRLDPESTGEVQNLLFGFGDLTNLTDLELQSVLTGIDHWDLALAMRTAPQSLKRRITSNISRRRAKHLVEDEAALEDIDDSQVEAIQHLIIERVRYSYEEGSINTYFGSIAKSESDDEAPEVSQVDQHSPKRDRAVAAKPEEKRKYGLGVGIGLVFLAIAYFSLSWFAGGRTKSASTPVKTAQSSLSRESEPDRSVRGQPGKAKMGGTQASEMASIEGRALLMSGESVRSLEGQSGEPGDQIQTGSDGRAAVQLWPESGEMQLEANSSVKVGETGEGKAGPPELDLRVGNIMVQVKDPALAVRSPLASVHGSEGALYRLRITLDSKTIVEVHEGTVIVKSRASGADGTWVLHSGEEVSIYPSGKAVISKHGQESVWLDMFR